MTRSSSAREPTGRCFLMLPLLVLVGSLVAGAGAGVRAQEAPPMRLWAAQTAPNQVTLSWEEVPGAVEYRIYAGDPDAATTPAARRPISVLSGSGRYAIITGINRTAAGLYLEAMGADRRRRRKVRFNDVTPVRGVQTITAPAEATATATSASEVTLSWTAVPGATAYILGRAVSPGGFRMLCQLCSTDPTYVDRDVTSGAAHSYTVIAVFPTGISPRTLSNIVTPGAPVVVAGGTTTSGNPGAWTSPPSTTPTTAYTPPGQPAGGTTTYTPPGTPAGGTTTYTPPGTPAGTTGSTTTAPDTAPPRVNPQIPVTVPDTTPPPIGPMPSGAESLATPPADTGSCVVRTATTTAPTDTIERIDPRADAIDLRTNPNPDATVTGTVTGVATTTNLGSADYQRGKCLNPGATGYPGLWDVVASNSGMTSADRIAAWKEIGIVALEYQHILNRMPRPDETRRDVAALKAGTTWFQLWRQLAHSAERDSVFGFWAPAPIPDAAQAKSDFGLTVAPWTAQQCYGGLGPKCGGLPEALNIVNDRVYAYWFGAFKLPDNTEFAYIEMGVAVGSILHDNACLQYKEGLNCNGLGAGDLIKNVPLGTTGIPVLTAATLEWNKAAWNLIDGRTWRAKFGPYPTNLAYRDAIWYDDLRPLPSRPAMMAPAVSMFTWPGLTITYTGGETRRSRALLAPAGTVLDATDVAFCRSGVFGTTGSFPGKAPWGVCADGVAMTGTHAATPATGTPTTGTTASCKLDYMRADNMWAAFGRPDGFLGTESITLAAGEHKVFVTDWKFEKQRNDGTTYYGSHLRVATNSSSRPIQLQLVTNAGTTTSSVRLDPNTRKEFQADLRDVYCES